jgi:hydroxymethylpyrimidine kinase/phosphomethylpyrimidine kinase
MNQGRPIILSIAGFDPGSGAGVTADLKTIAAFGGYGIACVTALTVQNTLGVIRVEPASPDTIRDTLAALAEDFGVGAVRIGMLGTGEVAHAVADALERYAWPHIVLDPVLQASSGLDLLHGTGFQVLTGRLFPLASVLTPNIPEAERLTGIPIKGLEDASRAARRLQEMGARNVVITGGHQPQNEDLLRQEDGSEQRFALPRIETPSTHGTGCAFATALACCLAMGEDLAASVRQAKQYVRDALKAAYPVGHGRIPPHHLFRKG